jgi:hypothetical protein
MWFLPPDASQGLKPLPDPPSPDTRPPLLRTAGEDTLLPSEVITRAQVSCWYSHYQVLLKIARGEDQVAIVLEDDVDMEVRFQFPSIFQPDVTPGIYSGTSKDDYAKCGRSCPKTGTL